jgi:hypothetical protein
LNSELAQGQRRLAVHAEQAAALAEAGAGAGAATATEAKDKIERLKKGEAVAGGFSKPLNIENLLRAEGWTDSDFRHIETVGAIARIIGDEASNRLAEMIADDSSRRRKVIARTFLRKLMTQSKD